MPCWTSGSDRIDAVNRRLSEMKQIKRIARVLVSTLLDFASWIVPRDAMIWVVGGDRGLRYADNSMHFFRHCMGLPRVKAVWLSRSRSVVAEVREEGGTAHLVHSLPGIWYGLRAAWHVHDVAPADSGPGSRGAHRMNLWHGIPLKDISFLREGVERRRASHASGLDHFPHPNHLVEPILHAFDLVPERIVLANLPRNRVFEPGYDPLRDAKASDRPWIASLMASRIAGKRVIGYFPTWRGGGEDLFLGTCAREVIHALADFLAARGLLLVTKWHTCSFRQYGHSGASRTATDIDAAISGHASIVSLPFDLDLNSVLPACDLLVTDYSSVLFDFALSDKPQLFFPYDLEQYRASVGFLHEYESLVPGRVVRTMEDFLQELDAYRSDPAAYAARDATARQRLRHKIFEVRASSGAIADYMSAVMHGLTDPARRPR